MTTTLRRLLLSALVLLPLACTTAFADDDDDEDSDDREEHEVYEHRSLRPRASLPLYGAECGSCHLAYPPGLLPARSWASLMGNLGDHFGDNAELPQEQRDAILRFLAAEAGPPRLDPPKSTPTTRITALPWFRHEHDEVPTRLVKDNPEVRSYARCDACHTRAGEGSFRESEIRIPRPAGR